MRSIVFISIILAALTANAAKKQVISCLDFYSEITMTIEKEELVVKAVYVDENEEGYLGVADSQNFRLQRKSSNTSVVTFSGPEGTISLPKRWLNKSFEISKHDEAKGYEVLEVLSIDIGSHYFTADSCKSVLE